MLLGTATISSILAMMATMVVAETTQCTSIDYEAFYDLIPSGEVPSFGVQGLYYEPHNEDCALLDVFAPSFKNEHMEMYDLYMSVLENVSTEAAKRGMSPFEARGAKELFARAPKCGNSCSGTKEKCSGKCSCKSNGSFCVAGPGPNNCFTLYKCK